LLSTTVSVAQDYTGELGVQLRATATPKDLLEAQATCGFAHVSEKTMEDVLVHKGKEVPSGDEGDNHRKTDLALACIAAIKPDMPGREASRCVARAFVEENPECYSDVLVDENALGDVVNAGEAKKVAEHAARIAATKAMKALAVLTRERRLPMYFARAAPQKYTAAQRRQPRWLPKRDEQNTDVITKWILGYIPPDVTVDCDDYNGRWRVISPNLDWKSISWTKRGFEAASCEVIDQAWAFHNDCGGAPAPFDLNELSKRWKDDGVLAS
jgi:hypothetical protein